MVQIDIERAEKVFMEMKEERDRSYPHISDDRLLLAVFEGASEYERKKMKKQQSEKGGGIKHGFIAKDKIRN